MCFAETGPGRNGPRVPFPGAIRIVAVLFLAWCAAWAGGCSPAGDEPVPEDLLAAVDSFYAAVERGDAETRIALFSNNPILMPNHWTPIIGTEGVGRSLRSGGDAVFRIRNREILDMGASESLAYTVNSYEYTYHPKGSDPQWHRTKNVHIWKRDPKGEWKLHVDIWNSDVPMDRFGEE